MSATSNGSIDRDRQIFGESEGSLQAIVDTIPSFVWRGAPDGGKEFLNQRWHEYTGLSPAEAHGWGWRVVVHPDDLDRLLEEWQVILASRSSGEMEVRIRRFDGNIVGSWCERFRSSMRMATSSTGSAATPILRIASAPRKRSNRTSWSFGASSTPFRKRSSF